ncbi:methyltransferase [Halomonas chromatireducens]|uniref:methyltransferase n=1 Tax=Halomonas chromatireducens TaxID=507626 RepID=UPI000833A3DD|nr:methyltransferase [Halomonas chromatireducens]
MPGQEGVDPQANHLLARLTELLSRWQPLWRPLPFQYRCLPWHDDFAALGETLLGLSEQDVVRLQANPFHASPLAEWLPVAELEALVDLPILSPPVASLPREWGQHVGGRKWSQIEAFVEQLRIKPGESLVEWCAGKGHLARTLARRHAVDVTALEWQGALCDEGRQLAQRQGVAVDMRQQDVMASQLEQALSSQTHIAALHACGDLHVRLLQLAAETGSSVTLAPCCYQRTRDEVYRPLSRRAKALIEAHDLLLSREDLAMSVQETVTAPGGVQRSRERANAWRLGFDEWQRQVRGIDAYLPVPSLAYGRMPDNFADFCRWAAQQKGLSHATDVDWASFEAAGWRRQCRVKRLELVRHLFRRPLEVWLALDRMTLLTESGFDAELGIFCDRELTPRNLLLRASHSSGQAGA